MITLAMTLVATVLVMVIAVVLGVGDGPQPAGRHGDPAVPGRLPGDPAVRLPGARRWRCSAPSRFTAIVAAVAYAVPIATKLVADGIRGVVADDGRGGPRQRQHHAGR